jgi:hypothetical protein
MRIADMALGSAERHGQRMPPALVRCPGQHHRPVGRRDPAASGAAISARLYPMTATPLPATTMAPWFVGCCRRRAVNVSPPTRQLVVEPDSRAHLAGPSREGLGTIRFDHAIWRFESPHTFVDARLDHAAPPSGAAFAGTVLRISTMLSTSVSGNTSSGPVGALSMYGDS